MINTINVEYTRSVLQKKYGTPHGFTYKQAVPIYLEWDFETRGSDPDYIFVNSQNPYSIFFGECIVNTDSTMIGSFTHRWNTPDIEFNHVFIDVGIPVLPVTGNTIVNLAQYQQKILFNSLQWFTIDGTQSAQFAFTGFFFEQP
jgi:hypothetical protein